MLPVLQLSIHQPFTMLWPTDKAFDSMPIERQNWLSSPDNQEQVTALVKAHIIRNSRVRGERGKGNRINGKIGLILINVHASLLDIYMCISILGLWSSIVVCVVISQHEGYLLSSQSCPFWCGVCMVLWFSPIVQNYALGLIGDCLEMGTSSYC